MSRYDQGSRKNARMLSFAVPSVKQVRRTWSQVWEDVRVGVMILVLGFIAFTVLLGLAGCATTPLAVANPLVEIRDHQTISGLVKVAQMSVDCDEQDVLLKRVVSDAMVGNGAPAPDKLDIRPLSGSSLCGMAQGEAEPVRMAELGARDLAVAEVTIYWSSIGYSELQKAHAVLTAMRPIPDK